MTDQRIPPLAPSEFTPEVLAITRGLHAAAGMVPTDYVSDFVATVMRHPTLYKRHFELAFVLMRGGALSPRDRELFILRTAWLTRAPFEWGEHVAIGKRDAGLTGDEVERVTQGPDAAGWSADDAAIVRAVDEMHAHAEISDATWAALAARLDEQQLLELPILYGQYVGAACLLKTVRFALQPDNEGLSAR
jgi:4-carboxymuconolactone decarboxylase